MNGKKLAKFQVAVKMEQDIHKVSVKIPWYFRFDLPHTWPGEVVYGDYSGARSKTCCELRGKQAYRPSAWNGVKVIW